MDLSMQHTDLLLSRLFHDLISPVTAARNGVELVGEFGDADIGNEAMGLIGDSVEQAVARLTFFRVAFGGAGSSVGHTLEEANNIAKAYLASRKVSCEFTIASDAIKPKVGFVKTLLGTTACAADCLPRGGTIMVTIGGEETKILTDGAKALANDDFAACLAGEKVELSERLVLPSTVAMNAKRFSVSLELVEREPPMFRLKS